jgi:hypothetical protein
MLQMEVAMQAENLEYLWNGRAHSVGFLVNESRSISYDMRIP